MISWSCKLLLKFMKGFLQVAKPFSNILKKELSFEWVDKNQKAFENLKQEISSLQVSVKFFQFHKTFKVHTMRIFCHQRCPHDRWASHSFSEHELLGAQLKWLIHEMELYIMVNCLKT